MPPRWFTASPAEGEPPVGVPVSQLATVQSARRAGIRFPPRLSDCTGVRPSWFPFQVNVCDVDLSDPVDLTARQMKVPGF